MQDAIIIIVLTVLDVEVEGGNHIQFHHLNVLRLLQFKAY